MTAPAATGCHRPAPGLCTDIQRLASPVMDTMEDAAHS
jgi:hypothetical protein